MTGPTITGHKLSNICYFGMKICFGFACMFLNITSDSYIDYAQWSMGGDW